MSEVTVTKTWREQLASLVDNRGIVYSDDGISFAPPLVETTATSFIGVQELENTAVEPESFKDQVKGFLTASAEMLIELARGCRDVAQQNFGNDDSFIVQKFGGPWAKVFTRLKFLNEYLPEDRDPVHAWPVIFFVSILALAALNVNTAQDSSAPKIKEVLIHPPSANYIQLPDGRHIAYQEQGVPADRARFSLIAPHSFLSSRLAGIPGVKASLLEEFGVRLVTYDLPGFGESDPHPIRNLNSSAMDMSYIADATGVTDKFWVMGYSGGSIHAWAALRYIPERLAGAIMFAPMVNPYESTMTKEEKQRTLEKWTPRRKLKFFLARRFPRFLAFFYCRSFLAGKHGQIDKWLSVSLGKRDKALVEEPIFETFWQRDVEESVRQGIPKPFMEEAVLQVSNWGFSLADLKLQQKSKSKGILDWIKSLYSQPENELIGFLGPIHIWQGMDDRVVPPSMTDYVHRVLPGATVHQLSGEGHFSYFCFCDECHRQIFSTLFGAPQGPLNVTVEADLTSLEEEEEKEEADELDEVPLSAMN